MCDDERIQVGWWHPEKIEKRPDGMTVFDRGRFVVSCDPCPECVPCFIEKPKPDVT